MRRSQRRGAADVVVLVIAAVVVLFGVVDTDNVLLSDEGAALLQARVLADAGDFTLPVDDLARSDPGWLGFVNSRLVGNEYAPYAERPAYAVAAAATHRAMGGAGPFLLSVAGMVAAATAARRLARRVIPGSERLAFWITAIGSPLWFLSFQALAHTLAAAASGLAMIGLLSVQPARTRIVGLIGAVLAVLMRPEAMLFVGCLAAVTVVTGIRRGDHRVRLWALIYGGSAAAAEVASLLLDRRLFPGGHSGAGGTVMADGGVVLDRLKSFYLSVVSPGYGSGDVLDSAVIAGAAAVVLSGVLIRRRPAEVGIAVFAVSGAALIGLRAVVGGAEPISGIVLAAPAIFAGVVPLRWRQANHDTRRLLLATGLFLASLLSLQHSVAGGFEWGWRYAAPCLPALGLLAAAGIRDGCSRLVRTDLRRTWIGSLAFSVVLLAVLGVQSLRSAHEMHRRAAESVAHQAAELDGPGPRVVVSLDAFARLAWQHLDGATWLSVPHGARHELVARLRAAGIDRFVYVGYGDADVEPFLLDFYVASSAVLPQSVPPREWRAYTLVSRS